MMKCLKLGSMITRYRQWLYKKHWQRLVKVNRPFYNERAKDAWEAFSKRNIPSYVTFREYKNKGITQYEVIDCGMPRKMTPEEKVFYLQEIDPHNRLQQGGACPYCGIWEVLLSKYGSYPCPKYNAFSDPVVVQSVLGQDKYIFDGKHVTEKEPGDRIAMAFS